VISDHTIPMRWFSFLVSLLVSVIVPWVAAAADDLTPARIPEGLCAARIFGDHMILQRQKPVTIWGWAKAGETVTVSFAGQSKTATAGTGRLWRVTLEPMEASFEGRELTVTSPGGALTFRDVLVGEVWHCGGQSNMSFPLWVRTDGFEEKDADKFPFIRAMATLHGEFADPPYDVKKTASGDPWLIWALPDPQPTLPFDRPWMVFGKEALGLHGQPFSAFGFWFARKLYEELKVPIGLVDTSVGGTLAHYWASPELLRGVPEMKEILARPSPPWVPGCLYHTTILPIRDFAMRGSLFYLGENNSMDPVFTRAFEGSCRAVIASWRDAFRDPAHPFCLIQTGNCGPQPELYGPSGFQIVQEAQLRIQQTTPHTGITVTADELHGDLHNMRKQAPAERTVRWAMAEVYGRKDKAQPWGSPVLVSHEARSGRLVLEFRLMGDDALTLRAEPSGFVIAGSDRKFIEAKAKVIGPRIVEVWNESMAEPVAARFGWAGRPILNLWTTSGLPVSPFRTDPWSMDP
jgi:sialate O-acetylesterase